VTRAEVERGGKAAQGGRREGQQEKRAREHRVAGDFEAGVALS